MISLQGATGDAAASFSSLVSCLVSVVTKAAHTWLLPPAVGSAKSSSLPRSSFEALSLSLSPL